MATTSAEALARVRELEPDVTIVDIDLNGESGFDLAWQLASISDGPSLSTILTSTRSESDFAELVAVTPARGDAAQIEFADAVEWYQSPEHAFQRYERYLADHFDHGAARVRVVAEVIWPQKSATADVAEWKRYEAGISPAMAAVPVSFICAYDTRELPAGIVMDARRTHPVLRSAEGARPSADYSQPAAFVRGLERVL